MNITLLQQQISVISKDVDSLGKNLQQTQKEISEVLGEMQMTIQGIARALNMSMAVVNERLTRLEPIVTLDGDIPAAQKESGVEL